MLCKLPVEGNLGVQGEAGKHSIEGVRLVDGIVYNIQRMSTKDGPGLRTTIFLKGCPLHCPWCSNPESQSFKPQLMVFANLCTGCGECEKVCPQGAVTKRDGVYNRDRTLCTDCGACVEVCPAKAREMSGKRMSVEDILRISDSDSLFYSNSGGGVTIGGGEPTAAGDFLLDLLAACNRRGYHTCIDTCGVCEPERFREVMRRAELFLFDCKHMDPEEHKRLTGRDNAIILKNLHTLFESGREVRVRVPLMPGVNDTEKNIADMAMFLHKHGRHEIDVLPCHTFGYSKYDALNLPRPHMGSYQPGELQTALARFAKHDLMVTIIV